MAVLKASMIETGENNDAPPPSQLGTGKNTQERMCAIASTCEVFRQMLIISNVAVTLLSSAQQRFPG